MTTPTYTPEQIRTAERVARAAAAWLDGIISGLRRQHDALGPAAERAERYLAAYPEDGAIAYCARDVVEHREYLAALAEGIEGANRELLVDWYLREGRHAPR